MDPSIIRLLTWMDNLTAGGRYQRVREVCIQTLKLARDQHDVAAESASLSTLAQVYTAQGQRFEAWTLASGAFDKANESGEELLVAESLLALGRISLDLTRQPYDALGDYSQAYTIGYEAGDIRMMVLAMTGLSAAYALLEDTGAARRCAFDAMQTSQQAEPAVLKITALARYGGALLADGGLHQSAEILKQALDQAGDSHFMALETEIHLMMGRALAEVDEYASGSASAFQHALNLAEKCGNVPLQAQATIALGHNHLLWDEYDAAQAQFDAVVALAEQHDLPMIGVWATLFSGVLADTQGDHQRAAAHYERAQLQSATEHNPYHEALAKQRLSRSLAALHDFDDAIEQVRSARKIYLSVADDQHARGALFETMWLYIQLVTDRLLRLVGLRPRE